MTDSEILEHVVRSFKAFSALVVKIDAISQNEEFRGVWILHQVHGGVYHGPTWEPELTEAKECLQVALDNPIVSHGTSDHAQDDQNEQDQQQEAEATGGSVTPAATPTPARESPHQQQD